MLLECEGDSELKPFVSSRFQRAELGSGAWGHLGSDLLLYETKMCQRG